MTSFRTSIGLPLALAAATFLTTSSARAEGSRWIALLPFGIGQFQNRDVGLGIFFAAGQAVLGGMSIASYVAVEVLAGKDTTKYTDVSALNRSIRDAAVVNRLSFTAWATLATAGIVEAQVSFGRRARRATREATMTPIVAPLPGGAFIGVASAF